MRGLASAANRSPETLNPVPTATNLQKPKTPLRYNPAS